MLFVRSLRPRVDLKKVTGAPQPQSRCFPFPWLVCPFVALMSVKKSLIFVPFSAIAAAARGGANLASRVHARGVVNASVRLRECGSGGSVLAIFNSS